MMVLLVVIAFFSINQLKESFGKDLNYLEGDGPATNSTTAVRV